MYSQIEDNTSGFLANPKYLHVCTISQNKILCHTFFEAKHWCYGVNLRVQRYLSNKHLLHMLIISYTKRNVLIFLIKYFQPSVYEDKGATTCDAPFTDCSGKLCG